MAEKTTKTWLITGCSTGLGRALAERVLQAGGRVVATARDPAHLQGLAQEAQADSFLPVTLDVTRSDQIKDVVGHAVSRFGGVEVLVNNAGYGYQSSVEEGEDEAIRAQFEANVFGLFALTRAVLPVMRERKDGHVINITSVAGFIGFAGSGYYAASKHAVEGWSDALAAEGKPLGIRVTCVEPGPFRTDWAGRSLKQTPSRIADYVETAGARLKATSGYSGKQAGDPVRAADAMIRLAGMDGPPRHLVLGRMGFDSVTAKLRERLASIEADREISLGADYPDA